MRQVAAKAAARGHTTERRTPPIRFLAQNLGLLLATQWPQTINHPRLEDNHKCSGQEYAPYVFEPVYIPRHRPCPERPLGSSPLLNIFFKAFSLALLVLVIKSIGLRPSPSKASGSAPCCNRSRAICNRLHAQAVCKGVPFALRLLALAPDLSRNSTIFKLPCPTAWSMAVNPFASRFSSEARARTNTLTTSKCRS